MGGVPYLKGGLIIFTLGQIKTRIWMTLEEYTHDGAPTDVNHTHLADIRQRMPDAIDAVQRKIAQCGRKKVREAKLIFSLPETAGETLSLPDLSSGVRVPISDKAKAYSLTLKSGDAVVRFLSLSYDGEVTLGSVSLECGWGEERRYTGFIPSGAKFLCLEGEGEAVELVFYSSSFPSEKLIPPSGYSSCPLPSDVMALLALKHLDGCAASGELREEDGLLLYKGEGEFILSYERYPCRVDASTPEECVIELDDFCCDALVYGAASMLCPLSQSSLYLKVRGLFEEAMANLYNSAPLAGQVSNSMFMHHPKREGFRWRSCL